MPLLCGFRKGYSPQYVLINLQKCQGYLDASGRFFGKLLMQLSKAHDYANHDLIITKLEAYRDGENNSRLIKNYLSQRKIRVKVGSSLSEWLEIILEVPLRSIVGPILFNVFCNDLLFFIKEKDICNLADYTTAVGNGSTLATLVHSIKKLKKVLTSIKNRNL